MLEKNNGNNGKSTIIVCMVGAVMLMGVLIGLTMITSGSGERVIDKEASARQDEITVNFINSTYKSVTEKPAGWFSSGQDADIMLSGIDFNNTGGPLLFNHQGNVASDGTHLLLADRNNNRVLIWNTAPTENSPPNIVLGQENFYANNPGTGLNHMCWPVSVATDGQHVVVADTYNDRILIWNNFSTLQNGTSADFELKAGIGWPWAVWTNGTKLVVASTSCRAVLIWNTFPTSNTPADISISLLSFGTPRAIASDGNHLVIGDHNAVVNGTQQQGNFFWKTFPTQNNQSYDFFVAEVSMMGQQNPPQTLGSILWGAMTSDGKLIGVGNQLYIWDSFPENENDAPDLSVGAPYSGAAGYDFGGSQSGDGSGVAMAGDKLYISLSNGNKVVCYNSLPIASDQNPDFAVGAPDIYTNTLKSNYFITNPAPVTDGESLFISSDFDRKLYVWKQLPDESGAKPDIMYNLSWGPQANALFGSTLVLAGGNFVYVWNTLPLNGELPDLWFMGSIGNVTFQDLRGVALDNKYFYLADKTANKIYVWEGIPNNNTTNAKFSIDISVPTRLSSDGTYLVVAATEAAFNERIKFYKIDELSSSAQGTNLTGVNVNLPESALAAGGHLFIADTVFNRVLVWNNISDAVSGNHPDIVLGEEDFDDTQPEIGIDKLFWPARLTFDGSYLWVGEYKFSCRVVRFSVKPVSHGPIYIDGNSNFTSTNGVVSGNGTETNPYIIENWDINASSAHGIEIRNTDVYFIIRNCIVQDGKSNDNDGVYFYSVQNGKIGNCEIHNNYYGITLASSSNNNITNCSISNSGSYDFYLSASYNIFVHNTTFTKTKVYYYDTTSNMTVFWYLHVKVINSTSTPISGATVRVQDNANGTYDQNYTTDSDGWVRWIECTEYWQNQTTKIYYTPHNVTVSKIGYAMNYSEPNMDSSKEVTITLNKLPNTPSNPSPSNGATGQSINVDLSWSGGDPDAGDTVTYDVYFGTSSSPPYYGTTSDTSYNLPTLSYNTHYYWQIIAKDNHEASTSGPVWDFTTEPQPNQPPSLSSGYVSPTTGTTSTTFTYYVTYTDADNDAPATKYVYINGTAYTMSYYSGSYTTGAVYKYSTTMSSGTHNYYFYFSDGTDTARLPSSGTYSGPSVNDPPNPPTLVAPANNTWTNDSTPYFDWDFSDTDAGDTQSGFHIQINNVSDFSTPEYECNNTTSSDTHWQCTYTLYDGTWYWRVKTKDNNGAWGNWGSYFVVKIDTTIPAITISGVTDGAYYNISVTPVIDITDPNLNTTIITLNDELFVSGTIVSPEDDYTLHVEATDNANNAATKTVSFTIDKTKPTIDITGVINNAYYNVSVTPIIEITDINLNISMVTVTLNSESFISGTTITDDGDYVLIVQAMDKAGNTASKSISFTIDKTDPVIDITGVANNTYYNVSATPIIEIIDINLNTITITLNDSPFTSGAEISTEGVYYLNVTANDLAGNTATQNIIFTIDSTPPTIKSTIPPADGSVNIKKNITIVFSEEMNQTAAQAAFSISPNPGGWGWSWNVAGDTMTGTHNDFEFDTAYTVTITTAAKDLAGNYMFSNYSWSFTTAVGAGVSVISPNTTSVWTGGSTHNIEYEIIGGVAPYTFAISYSTDDENWSVICTATTDAEGVYDYSWYLPGIDSETVTVKIIVEDSDGTESSDTSGNFEIDSTAPEVNWIIPEPDSEVVAGQYIVVQFTEPVDKTSALAAFSITPDPGGWSWEWNVAGDKMTGTHNPFEVGKTYTCSISTNAKDKSEPGNFLDEDYSWNFTAISGRGDFVVSLDIPSSPEKGGTYPITVTVSNTGSEAFNMSGTLTVKFYESMDNETWTLIDTRYIPSMGAGNSSSASTTFTFSDYGSYYFLVEITSTNPADTFLGGETTGRVSASVNIPETQINHAPVVNSITANPTTVTTGETVTIAVDATDEDIADTLTYVYSCTGGTVSGSGSTVTWTAPSTAGDYTVTVYVDDGEVDSNSKSVTITVEKPEKKEKGFIPSFETAAFLIAMIGVCIILLRKRKYL